MPTPSPMEPVPALQKLLAPNQPLSPRERYPRPRAPMGVAIKQVALSNKGRDLSPTERRVLSKVRQINVGTGVIVLRRQADQHKMRSLVATMRSNWQGAGGGGGGGGGGVKRCQRPPIKTGPPSNLNGSQPPVEPVEPLEVQAAVKQPSTAVERHRVGAMERLGEIRRHRQAPSFGPAFSPAVTPSHPRSLSRVSKPAAIAAPLPAATEPSTEPTVEAAVNRPSTEAQLTTGDSTVSSLTAGLAGWLHDNSADARSQFAAAAVETTDEDTHMHADDARMADEAAHMASEEVAAEPLCTEGTADKLELRFAAWRRDCGTDPRASGSMVQQPAVQQPVAQQPVVQQPAVHQPAVQQPAVQQPVAQQRTDPMLLQQMSSAFASYERSKGLLQALHNASPPRARPTAVSRVSPAAPQQAAVQQQAVVPPLELMR